jgi:hypothetical protein
MEGIGKKKNPFTLPASKLYRPSDRCFSAKLVPKELVQKELFNAYSNWTLDEIGQLHPRPFYFQVTNAYNDWMDVVVTF